MYEETEYFSPTFHNPIVDGIEALFSLPRPRFKSESRKKGELQDVDDDCFRIEGTTKN